jgi:hypothetical protein
MNGDCVEVDKLILHIADYKKRCADVAAEKLTGKCSTSSEAYRYLRKPLARRTSSSMILVRPPSPQRAAAVESGSGAYRASPFRWPTIYRRNGIASTLNVLG